MTEISNGESGASVRAKLNQLFDDVDAAELSIDAAQTDATQALADAAAAQADATQGIADAATAQSGANASLKIASNLSDLNNAATARTNLGLGTAATTAAADYATAAQGTTADTVSADFAADRAKLVDDVTALLADTSLTYTADQPGTVAAGDIVRTRSEGFAYQVLDVAASGDVTNSNSTPVQFRALLERKVGKSNIIAHRGFRNLNVQNTMLAFAEALKWTQHLECDVQYSADGTAYIFHDTTVDALTSGTGTFTALSDATINGLTFDALSGLDLSSLVRIPTFDEFLTYASRRNAFVWPEIKNPRTSADVDTICQDVLDAKMQNRCVLQVSFIDYAEQAMDYDREVSCGYINANTALAPVQGFVDRLAAYPNRGWLITSYDVITANPSLVEYCRVRRVGLACWTIPNQTVADELTSLGVENFITDVPLFVGER